MELGLLCVPCAVRETLRAATAMQAGVSVCGAHRRPARSVEPPAEDRAVPAAGRLDCLVCSGEGRERRAWFVVDGGSLCIRHAAHAATTTDEYGDDDMGAHDFAHAVYQALGRLGVPHAY